MNSRLTGLVIVSILVALTPGCAVQRAGKVDRLVVSDDDFVATDAQKRVIATSAIGPGSRPGTVDPLRVVCSEPSPDVAVTVANSLSASLSVFARGSGSISSSSAAALAQLVERTATIQLLRDKMYQTCLAYANGGMTRTTYSLVMSRLDDTIVTMLMGENAAGAFGRSLSALGVGSGGETSADLAGVPAAAAEVSDLADSLRDAQAKVAVQEAALAEKKAAVAAKETPTAEELDAVKTAESGVDSARSKRDELLKKLQNHASTLAKGFAKPTHVTAAGGISHTPDPQVAQVLSEMQQQFLTNDFTDSLVSACLIELGANPSTADLKAAAEAAADAVSRTQPAASPANSAAMLGAAIKALNNQQPSALAKFCESKLLEAMEAGRKHQAAMEATRARVRAEATTVQQAQASTSLERARSERLKATVAAIDKCHAFEDAAERKSCIRAVEHDLPAASSGS